MVKLIWILLKQEIVSGSGISWAIICKSAPRSRQTTTPAPHHFMPPNQHHQRTEGTEHKRVIQFKQPYEGKNHIKTQTKTS